MSKKVFYANIYRYAGGYIFGDNMLRHKTLGEAVKASKDNLDYAGAVRIEIEERESSTAISGHVITKRV